MVREILVQMTSPAGYPIHVVGFRFGEGRPKVAIVGGLRGDEVHQNYVVARLCAFLRREAERNPGVIQGEILLVPLVNTFGFNVGYRFWPPDATDIDRMFPGFRFGETTQILAYSLFEKLKDADFGVHVASLDPNQEHMALTTMYRSGLGNIEAGSYFGTHFLYVKDPKPFDTGSLLYNWQVWDVRALGLAGGKPSEIQEDLALEQTTAILRFLSKVGVLKLRVPERFSPVLLEEADLLLVRNRHPGLFVPLKAPGYGVFEGETLGWVRDTLTGEPLEELQSPALGTVFFRYARPAIFEEEVAFGVATR